MRDLVGVTSVEDAAPSRPQVAVVVEHRRVSKIGGEQHEADGAENQNRKQAEEGDSCAASGGKDQWPV